MGKLYASLIFWAKRVAGASRMTERRNVLIINPKIISNPIGPTARYIHSHSISAPLSADKNEY